MTTEELQFRMERLQWILEALLPKHKKPASQLNAKAEGREHEYVCPGKWVDGQFMPGHQTLKQPNIMTKKHFIALADHVRIYNKFAVHPFNEPQLHELADFCKSQNGQFNRERWLDYIAGKCGPNGGKK